MAHQLAAAWTSLFSAPWHAAPPRDDTRDSAQPGEAGCVGAGRTPSRSAAMQPDQRVHEDSIGGVPMSDLLVQLRAGHMEAFETLYRALFRVLWNVATVHTQSGDIAEEVVHDVFLKVWTARETIRIDGDIRAYLSAAVLNATRNLHKHQKVVTTLETAVTQTGVAAPAIGQAAESSDAIVEHKEFLAAYRRALTTLTEQERVAAYLRWEEGWPFERIGAALAISKMGAHKVVARAQRKVQQLLADFRD